ncbi:hypothetical protein AB1K70_11690 [Bremerella sp. JC770]|uniref:hypothetical protein n=1 Tax=Bremerella sp. JC770 TaxID=3232137 RepID=UPI00345A48EA
MASLNRRQNTLHTPDGRYIIVDGVLWRATNPALSPEKRDRLVRELMAARRAVKGASDADELRRARQCVNDAKVQLGERGPVWWADGQPDWTRKKVLNSPYADWYQQQLTSNQAEVAAESLES